jgi:hypothetical protein
VSPPPLRYIGLEPVPEPVARSTVLLAAVWAMAAFHGCAARAAAAAASRAAAAAAGEPVGSPRSPRSRRGSVAGSDVGAGVRRPTSMVEAPDGGGAPSSQNFVLARLLRWKRRAERGVNAAAALLFRL